MSDVFEHTAQDYAERRARVEAGDGTATPEDYFRLGQYSALHVPAPQAAGQKFGVVFEASADVIPGKATP